jgi:hypothetical protein
VNLCFLLPYARAGLVVIKGVLPMFLFSNRAYSWGQYLIALGLLAGFGWLSGFIVFDIPNVLRGARSLWFVGMIAAPHVAVVFLSLPLWIFMTWPISRKRALLAGFVTSCTLIAVLSLEQVWFTTWFLFTSQLFWKILWHDPKAGALFVLLCTLFAGIIQRIIGPGKPPSSESPTI